MSRIDGLMALLRGWWWSVRPGVHAASIPRLLGPRCRLFVEAGGSLTIGRHCSFDRDVEIVVYRGGCLHLGDHVYVGHGSTIACANSIKIGNETMIADLVSIRDMNHRRISGRAVRECGLETRSIVVGTNCWIGSKATLVAGVHLGDEITVGANAVVTGVVASGLTVGGIPARALASRANVRE